MGPTGVSTKASRTANPGMLQCPGLACAAIALLLKPDGFKGAVGRTELMSTPVTCNAQHPRKVGGRRQRSAWRCRCADETPGHGPFGQRAAMAVALEQGRAWPGRTCWPRERCHWCMRISTGRQGHCTASARQLCKHGTELPHGPCACIVMHALVPASNSRLRRLTMSPCSGACKPWRPALLLPVP